jgi:hypothetical protein
MATVDCFYSDLQEIKIRREINMGRETVLFKSEEKKASSDIANTLRQIADKIDGGSMILKQGS